MNLKKMIKEFLPNSFLSILINIKNQKRLRNFYLLDKLDCDTKNLCSYEKIKLKEIFNNKKILKLWNNWQVKLKSFNISDVRAGVNSGDQKAIFFLINHLEPRSVLEIGTHVGASTINIASAINNYQKKKNLRTIFKTVDIKNVNSPIKKPWLEYGMSRSPYEMIQELKGTLSVDFVTKNSIDYLEKTQDTYDFIFLDGGHLPENVYQEIPKALKKLNKNGVILLHDYFPNGKPLWPNNYVIQGPYLATERLIKETNIKILPLGSLPWKTKLGSNKTSLALCLRK